MAIGIIAAEPLIGKRLEHWVDQRTEAATMSGLSEADVRRVLDGATAIIDQIERVIVGKRAVIPSGLHIGRNVVIGPGVQDELMQAGHLASGATVHPTEMPAHLYV